MADITLPRESVQQAADVLGASALQLEQAYHLIASGKAQEALGLGMQAKDNISRIAGAFHVLLADAPASGDRKEVWRWAPPTSTHANRVPKSQIIADSDALYFGTDIGAFVKLDRETGEVVWILDTNSPGGKGIWSTPVFYGERYVVFGAYNGNFYFVDRETGGHESAKLGDWIGSSPCVVGDDIWIGVEGHPRKGAMLCVHPDGIRRAIEVDALQHGSACCHGGDAVFGAADGRLIRSNKERTVWTAKGVNKIQGAPATDGRRIVAGSLDGRIYVLDFDGNVVRIIKTGGYVYTTPLLVSGIAYLGSSDGTLYCIDTEDGEVKAERRFDHAITGQPALVAASIIIGNHGGELHELDPTSLATTRRTDVPGSICERVLHSNGTFYVKTSDNCVRSLQ